ncbi:MAG: hypothetical protein QNJ58_12515 [Desulfobacterales bacterium]|nr:hypothetical protein [Desulfobacterales bacterium]
MDLAEKAKLATEKLIDGINNLPQLLSWEIRLPLYLQLAVMTSISSISALK